jgi:hypothetical protein
MRRRAFIVGLSGAAAWPLAVRAQQQAMPVIGFISAGAVAAQPYVTSFLQGLREAGFVEGQNVTVFRYSLDGQSDRLPTVLDDLIRRRAAVIFVGGRGRGNLSVRGSGLIFTRAAEEAIPVVEVGPFVPKFMSTETYFSKQYFQAGMHVGRILKGDTVHDDPPLSFVQQLLFTVIGSLVLFAGLRLGRRRKAAQIETPAPSETPPT